MEEKAALTQQLDEAHAQLRAALVGIDTALPVSPGWTIKHLLAHLTGWDEATTASLHAHLAGNEPVTPAVRGIDYYNAQSVATREPLAYEHIVKEWELARDQLKAAIAALPAEKLSAPLLFPWGSTGAVAELVAIFAEHEAEHAHAIQALKAQA